MDTLTSFVEQARSRHLTDQQITDALKANGWSEGQIQAALLGLSAPVAPASEQPAHHQTQPAGRPSISALEAALQHILLWFFTGATSIMIGFLAGALFTGSGSAKPFIAFVVVELVTFIPWAAFYYTYVKKQTKTPALATGKVWSIITIVFHSLGFLGSLITLLLVLILVHSDSNASRATILASATILVVDATVVAVYVAANFLKTNLSWRNIIIRFAPLLLAAIVVVYGIVAVAESVPSRGDDKLRAHMVTAAKDIHSYTAKNNHLPGDLATAGFTDNGVSYKANSKSVYQLCGTFNKSASSDYNGDNSTANSPADDNYVDQYIFSPTQKGYQCFYLQNTTISNNLDDNSNNINTNFQQN